MESMVFALLFPSFCVSDLWHRGIFSLDCLCCSEIIAWYGFGLNFMKISMWTAHVLVSQISIKELINTPKAWGGSRQLLNLFPRMKLQPVIKVLLVKPVLDLCWWLVFLASSGTVSSVVWLVASRSPLFFPRVLRDHRMYQNCSSPEPFIFIWEKEQPSNTFLLPISSAICSLSVVLGFHRYTVNCFPFWLPIPWTEPYKRKMLSGMKVKGTLMFSHRVPPHW